MMTRSMLLSALGFCALFYGEPEFAAADALRVGARPPALHLAAWVHGEPVDLTNLGDGQVYVIDFWTTWCPPCLTAVAQRSAEQAALAEAGVVFFGVTNESPEQVRACLDQYPGELHWRLACDDAGKSFAAYVEAAGQRRLPFAVVVDRQGRVAWHGDPRDRLAHVVRQVLRGQHDLERPDKTDQPDDGNRPDQGVQPGDRGTAGSVEGTERADSNQLTRAKAVADLHYLHDLLRLNYAGYDDLEWQLRCAGEGWAKRTEQFVARLQTQSSWQPQALYEVVREYLEPVQDAHFWTQRPPQLLGLIKPMPDRYITNYVPYFTNVRLRRDAGRMAVVKAPAGLEHLTGLALTSRTTGSTTSRRKRQSRGYWQTTTPQTDGPSQQSSLFQVCGRDHRRLAVGSLSLQFDASAGRHSDQPKGR